VAGLSTAFAGVAVPAVTAQAAQDVITVTNTDACNSPGSLEDALIQANASTNADGVRIVFDDALAGTGGIEFTGATCKMYEQSVGVPGGNHQTPGALGARFLIDSQVPVSIDFTNLDGIGTTVDYDYAGIYVRSNNVVLENLANMKAGAAGVAIGGTDVTVANFGFSDPDSPIAETGVALLDGATNVTVKDSDFASQWWSSILVDGSFSQPVTVSNIVIDNITSRGVESGVGHIDIEDGATVNGLSVTNSKFGVLDAETHTSHAVYFNTGLTVSDLTFSGNTVEQGAGAERNVFMFENSANSTFTDTVMNDNTFKGISRSQPLSRIIGDNTGTWTGLDYKNNTAEFTRGIRMSGTVSDALLDGNTFTETREPADAGITLGRAVSDVTVSNNVLDTVWAVDGIRVEGTSARNVVIEKNKIHDFYADVSRSAVAIVAPGEGNLVQDNEFIQHLDRGDNTDLPANMANHWAIYVWAEASAASATDTVGWSILNNQIDGFGGNPAIASQAPITVNARGKVLVTGNTFGADTRGSFDPETENLGYWFLWNDRGDANNRVQTFRAEQVHYNGTTATFTATQPDPELGNNVAAGPVTLHVYWTADNHAEEYLGAITDVAAGEVVSIATSHTSGYLRVQTVDANGFVSQYSSIDKNIVVAPAAPKVTEVTEDEAAGTGAPGAKVEVRDADGKVVGTATVTEGGTWTVDGLECGVDYTVVQIVNDQESEATEFTTDACEVPTAPAAPKVTEVSEGEAAGTGAPGAKVEVRDADGKVVGTATVTEGGTWTVDGLECGVDYTVVQIVGGEESEASEFTTDACEVPTAPAAPKVIEVTDDTIAGTGTPGADITVKDEDGKTVASAEVAADGSWEIDASTLSCGATYTVIQTVGGVQSDPTEFTTAACSSAEGPGGLAETGASPYLGLAGFAAAFLVVGGAALALVRTRKA